jgi:hypothetical protein
MSEIVNKKICKTCGFVGTEDLFYPKRKSCLECFKKDNKIRYQKHKEKNKKTQESTVPPVITQVIKEFKDELEKDREQLKQGIREEIKEEFKRERELLTQELKEMKTLFLASSSAK